MTFYINNCPSWQFVCQDVFLAEQSFRCACCVEFRFTHAPLWCFLQKARIPRAIRRTLQSQKGFRICYYSNL